MKYTALKGMRDVLPAESYRWQFFEYVVRDLCAAYNIREIRTPIVEHTALFLRGVGDTTDIVQKEMYTFEDKGGRSITMKPEGTAGAVRAMIEHGLFNDAQPTKMFYLYSPTYRYERPQAGRLREHHQFGVEVFGSKEASTDAELISLVLNLLERLGIGDLSLNINSIGCPACRPVYNQKLKEYYATHIENMCHDCKERYEKNPLRLLDCKEEYCTQISKDAPSMLEYLCEDCKTHFEVLQDCLDALGIAYQIDPGIVRGLDYYTKTVFEVISNHIGSQGTVCGGGRYDALVETCGGPDMPGVGFGMGMERILLVMEAQGVEIPEPRRCDVFVATFKDGKRALEICERLRHVNVRADYDPLMRSMKAQMRHAEKMGAAIVLIEGEDERNAGAIQIKVMEDGTQQRVDFEEAMRNLTEIFGMVMG